MTPQHRPHYQTESNRFMHWIRQLTLTDNPFMEACLHENTACATLMLRVILDRTDLEVERVTVTEPETFWQEVSRRFKDSMEDVGDNLKSFGAGVMGNAPHIVVFLVINGLIALIVVLIVRGSIKSAAKRRAKKQQN